MSKNLSRLLRSDKLVRASALLGFTAATLFAALVLFTGFGISDQYLATVQVLTGICYVFVALGSFLAVMGRASSTILRLGVVVVALIPALVLFLWATGALLDVLGVDCSGAWGRPQACYDEVRMWIAFYIYIPLFFPGTLILSGLLGAGILDEYRLSRKGAKKAGRTQR